MPPPARAPWQAGLAHALAQIDRQHTQRPARTHTSDPS
jgi:hypothetical protein